MPADQGAFAAWKNEWRIWLSSKFAESDEKNPDKYEKMAKCAEIYSWPKMGLRLNLQMKCYWQFIWNNFEAWFVSAESGIQ